MICSHNFFLISIVLFVISTSKSTTRQYLIYYMLQRRHFRHANGDVLDMVVAGIAIHDSAVVPNTRVFNNNRNNYEAREAFVRIAVTLSF